MGDASPVSLMTGHRESRDSPAPLPGTATAPMTPLLLALALVSRAASGAALAGAACYQPQMLAGISGLVLVLIFAGVVWPAVWSRDQQRRRAAARVLRQLLDVLAPGRSRR